MQATSLASAYRNHENEKKREYGERVRELKNGTFTPLVFSSTGGMGEEATVFYKRIAELISMKTKKSYSEVMRIIRCHLSFSLIRSAILCIVAAGRPSTGLSELKTLTLLAVRLASLSRVWVSLFFGTWHALCVVVVALTCSILLESSAVFSFM